MDISRRGNVEDIFLSMSSTLFGREILEGMGTLRKMYGNFLWCVEAIFLVNIWKRSKKFLVAIHNISFLIFLNMANLYSNYMRNTLYTNDFYFVHFKHTIENQSIF